MSQYTKTITLLEGECWWGGAIHYGTKMPFTSETIFTLDLGAHDTSNQVMPLLISNKGRFIWSEDCFKMDFNKGTLTIDGTTDITFEEGHGDLQSVYKEVQKRFFPANGKLPEKKLFTHPQYNTWIELMYDQEEDKILEYAERIIKEGYEPGILMIDDNWQEDYGVWEFSGTRFNDPKGMMKKLKDMGFLVMLWVCPFISPDSLTYRQLRDQGLLITDKDGEMAIRAWWNGYSADLDFTNPEAVKWFDERLHYLMDEYGVDGFKFDAGDPGYYNVEDSTYTTATPTEHARLYNIFGEKYALNEFRAGYKTAGMGLAQRLCDKNHSWDEKGLASLIPNGLAQGITGFAFTCPDMIGGGEYLNFLDSAMNLDQELVVRYAQSSALFPMMQFSAAPWRVLDEKHNALCKKAADIHFKYGEYILGLAEQSAENGAPIIQYMEYAYPNQGFENVVSQFMLGDKVLVAPVTEKGATTKEIIFPAGNWKGDDDSLVVGPTTITVDAPLERLPYYELVD